jgi:hypothetical protein
MREQQSGDVWHELMNEDSVESKTVISVHVLHAEWDGNRVKGTRGSFFRGRGNSITPGERASEIRSSSFKFMASKWKCAR